MLLVSLLALTDTLRLDLRTAERMALESNPTLLAQGKTASSSAWSARGAWAGYAPQLNIQGSYSDLGGYGFLPGGDTMKMYSATLSLSQPIFSPSSLYGALSARAQAGGQKALYERQKIQIVYQVDQAYFGLLKAMKTVEVREKAIARAREKYTLTEARYNLEDASLAELRRAEASLYQAEYELSVAKNSMVSAESGLLVLLGIPPGRPLVISEPTELPDTSPGSLDSLKMLALSLRQDYIQQKITLGSARVGFWYKVLTFLPEVDFSIYWRYYDPDFPTLNPDDYRKSSGISGQMSFNLTRYPFTIAAERDALASAEYSLMASSLAVQKDVEDAYWNLANAIDNRIMARAAYEAAKEAYDLTLAQFQLGAASQADIADAEEALINAELAQVSSEYDLFLAARRLELALGIMEEMK
ncbi:MAG: TolC family protein [candidate division WOR-3 bacterium]